MTVVMGIKKPTFIVLGADQLFWGFRDGKPTQGYKTKVVTHGSLPLAFATAGFAFLGNPGRATIDYIQDVSNSITTISDLTLEGLQELFENVFQDTINVMVNNTPPASLSLAKVDIIIGFIKDGEPSLGRLRFNPSPMLEVRNEFLSAPDSLSGFYTTGKYAFDTFVFGDTLSNAQQLSEHVRRVLQDGIEAEKIIYGGVNKEVGGRVDTVVIDPKGSQKF